MVRHLKRNWPYPLAGAAMAFGLLTLSWASIPLLVTSAVAVLGWEFRQHRRRNLEVSVREAFRMPPGHTEKITGRLSRQDRKCLRGASRSWQQDAPEPVYPHRRDGGSQ